MQKRHQALLSTNHDFLVNEIPMDATLEAIKDKHILSWHDFEQMKTLRHQGRRALARYFLAVLPHRGPKAFQALLESLQEANAQHLVDLLLQQAGAMNMEELFKTPPPGSEDDVSVKGPPKTPSDTPLPPGPDPHEYAVRLQRNSRLIRRFVEPGDISPVLAQNKVITAREADMVLHLNGKKKKWDLIMAALLQRGERAYQAFMAALLQKEYSTVFHTIHETTTEPSGSDDNYNDDYEDDDDDKYNKNGGTEGFHNMDDDNNQESDEDIKQETLQTMKRSSFSDDLLQDTVNGNNFSKADDTLLKGSRDLQSPAGANLESPVHWSRNGSVTRNGSEMRKGSVTRGSSQMRNDPVSRSGSEMRNGSNSRNGSEMRNGSNSRNGSEMRNGSNSRNVSEMRNGSVTKHDSDTRNDPATRNGYSRSQDRPAGSDTNGRRSADSWASYGNEYNNDYEGDNENETGNSNGTYKRGQRRISNAGILGSVQEEMEG